MATHLGGFGRPCKDCGVIITADNLYLLQNKIRRICKDCHKKRNSESRLKYQYGLTADQYKKMADAQNNLCAICHRPEREADHQLAVDHDHDTNKVRGLLCSKCNLALGNLEENEDIIWNMMEYLKKYKWSKAS